jgi:ribonuclease HI
MEIMTIAATPVVISQCYEGSQKHLSTYSAWRIDDDLYKYALMNYLAIPVVINTEVMDCSCTLQGYKGAFHKDQSRQALFPFSHMFNCSKVRGYMTYCHNTIVNHVVLFIRSTCPQIKQIVVEPRDLDMPKDKRRPDIRVVLSESSSIYIDVSVTNPAQKNFIKASLNQLLKDGPVETSVSNCTINLFGNREIERMKVEKHLGKIKLQHIDNKFYPFILDTTGQLGDKAKEFISCIQDLATTSKASVHSSTKQLKDKITHTCNLRGAFSRKHAIENLCPFIPSKNMSRRAIKEDDTESEASYMDDDGEDDTSEASYAYLSVDSSHSNKNVDDVKTGSDVNYSEKIVIQFDGGCRKNPGSCGGAGAVLYKVTNGAKLEFWSASMHIEGKCTNNKAEYLALIQALKAIEKFDLQNVHIEGDSQLVIKQMNGECGVRTMQYLFKEADELRNRLTSRILSFAHIDRNLNLRADYLANIAMDTKKDNILDQLQLVINPPQSKARTKKLSCEDHAME